jgi:hypothetical protein
MSQTIIGSACRAIKAQDSDERSLQRALRNERLRREICTLPPYSDSPYLLSKAIIATLNLQDAREQF